MKLIRLLFGRRGGDGRILVKALTLNPAALGVMFVASTAAAATTFTVNSVADAVASAPLDNGVCETAPGNGICTVRAAIMKANHFPGGGVTIVIPKGTYSLTIMPVFPDDELTGDLNVTATMTINGADKATTIIDANQIDRGLNSATGTTVTISGLTIRNGSVDGLGGGILSSGTLTLNDMVISGNQTGMGSSGGGVAALGTATLNNTVVTGNTADGNAGGIYGKVTLVLNNCSVTDNQTIDGGYGGGILSNAGTTLNNSVVSGNRTAQGSDAATSGKGGGIAHFAATLTIINSTISNNSALSDGGGIYNLATVFTYFTTIAGNLADNQALANGIGGGIFNDGGTVNLRTTLVAQNYAGISLNDLNGTIASQDYNFIQTTAGSTITGAKSHNITDSDPQIESQQNNGGTTQTRALFEFSPAIDAVPVVQCTDQFGAPLIVDQRDMVRPSGAACDIGAYEGSRPYNTFNRNLIFNGDAEGAAGSPVGAYVGVPYWTTDSGQFTAVPYNSPGGFPNLATDMVPLEHGDSFFAGGNGGNSSATQAIVVSPIAADTDAGKVNYTLSGDLGGFGDQDDQAQLTATFEDGNSDSIGSAVIGPVTAADRGFSTGFLHRVVAGVLPAGTRFISFELTTTVAGGSYNDGYADNLSLILTPPPTLANISTRLSVQTGDNVLIAGFIVTGTEAKKVIIRGLGPSLPLGGLLADPSLELYDGAGTLLESNDNWTDSPNKQAILDTAIPPTNDLESAIVRTLPANSAAYTAILRGVNNGTGIGIVEAYDLDNNVASKLANISTRGLVQTGDNVLIAGTIVIGQTTQNVLIRAIGPSLPLTGKLADPTLELHDGNGLLVESNDNWVDSPNKQAIMDTTIQPKNSQESAIVRRLLPGNYTAIVRGVNDSTGIALVEVYAID